MKNIFMSAMLFCLLAALVGPAGADEIYVPSNSPAVGGGNHWPWNATSSSEWRFQQLFSAKQLGFKGGVIKDIAFAPTSSGTHTATRFEMTMSHTTASSLVQVWAANLPAPVVVYPVAPHTWNPVTDTWTPVGLTQPFVYDGVSNLVVDLRYSGGKILNGFQGACHSDSGTATTILRSWNKGSGAYSAPNALSWNRNLGLITRITIDVITITGSGAPRPGGTVVLDLTAPADAGLVYQVGSSLGLGPTPIGNRQLNLSLDDLLLVSVSGFFPSLFQKYSGTLDPSGKAQATIKILNDPRLIGNQIHSAFLTLDSKAPQGIKSISRSFTFSILK